MRLLPRYLPFLQWLGSYRRADATGDLLAAVIVTLLLIPQSLAYAMLAGLPPQYGLYASIAPLAVYGLLGTSRTLSVGPVAVVALLTASALQPLAPAGSAAYVNLALTLALMVGAISLVLGLLRGGFIASLLSHPVVSGFVTGSSLLIILSQLKHLLGVRAAEGHLPWQGAWKLVLAAGDTNLVTLGLGVGALALLVLMRAPLRRLLQRWGVKPTAALMISRLGPAVLVALALALSALLSLHGRFGVSVVGAFAQGLPGLTVPELAWADVGALLPAALVIVLVGYVESVSVGRSLGARKRQAIDPSQELVALGAANIASAMTGGFPVTGGFSRSVVNDDAGARTGLASIVTAGLIALAALFAAPWFALLPHVVLAATVIVAVSPLVNVQELRSLWRRDRADGALAGLTIVAVLAFGVEVGVGAGVALSLLQLLWRAARPHMAVLGRVGETEHFRNVLRHPVTTTPGLLLLRVDESLFFANIRGIEDRLLALLAQDPAVRNVVLVCSGVNAIDSSAEHSLDMLVPRLAAAGVTVHLAEVKGPVMDRLVASGFVGRFAPGRIFLSTHEAVLALQGEPANRQSAQAA
ncbi:MAG: sulfate permease [Planctomycetes bacterium]|nr:sulfate permease [Planctomycetota bacterium]